MPAPSDVLARLWRWCKRKPVVAGLGGAVVLAMLIGTVVSFFAVRFDRDARPLTCKRMRPSGKRG